MDVGYILYGFNFFFWRNGCFKKIGLTILYKLLSLDQKEVIVKNYVKSKLPMYLKMD